MIAKDLKKLLLKLNTPCTRAMEAAAGFCISRGHYEVTVEHLLLKLMEDGAGDVGRIFAHYDVDDGRLWQALLNHLETLPTGNTSRPKFSNHLLNLVETAWVVGSVHHGASEVRSGFLVEALLDESQLVDRDAAEYLAEISAEDLRAHLYDVVAGSPEDAPRRAGRRASRPSGDGATQGDTALDLYTQDLTGRARDGDIDPVYARDVEIRQIIDILSRRRKNNPILVGEAGVGKTAVVEGLALRLAAGDVPSSLKDVEIRVLDLGLLQAGAGVKGEFENRVKSVIRDVREAPKPTVLFIDEAHTLIGAGGAAGTSDAANLLKPALARGELRTIAATTWSEYKKYIEKDPALERRFQRIAIDEPTPEQATVMLRGIKRKYELHHGVHVTGDAVTAAASLSARFVAGRQLPDKAVDLLDTASARVRMSQDARPPALDDLERRMDHIDLAIETLERDVAAGIPPEEEALDAFREERKVLEAEHAVLTSRWEREHALVESIETLREQISTMSVAPQGDGAAATPEATVQPTLDADDTDDLVGDATADTTSDADGKEAEAVDGEAMRHALYEELADAQAKLIALREEEPALVHAEVTEDAIASIISDWTGIPLGDMLRDEATTLLQLEDRLTAIIRGQDEAIAQVADSIRSAKAGMGNPEAPIAVFLLVGPSGVGKTETARQLADLLFGGERFLTTINMSEYQESHTVAQLKGAPPGYVGYGEGGILTEAVRRRPYSVVLLDEVEKAHVDVMELFYQVFDKGFMRDGEGRKISFRNTVIMMTSNVGSEVFLQMTSDETRPTPDALRDAIHPMLVRQFQAALLGRMKVVPYYPLHAEAMAEITRLKLDKIGRRLHAAHEIGFTYDASVVDTIAERCTQVDSGARNIDFIIDRTVLPAASRALLARMAEENLPEHLTLGLDASGGFTFHFDDAEAVRSS